MAKFIGGFGAVFILAAAIAVIIKFLTEINVIKDKKTVFEYGRVCLMTAAAGAAYIFIITLMYNCLKERANFFEFNRIFDYFGTSDVLRVCADFNVKDASAGLMMPLYPLIVYLAGTAIFNQYVPAAEYISFASACASSCLLYGMLKPRLGREKSADIILLVSALPCAFMLFAPSYISFTLMLILLGAHALAKRNVTLYTAAAAAACLSSKLGLAAFIIYPFYKTGMWERLAGKAEKCALSNRGPAERVFLCILTVVNGIIIYCLVRGAG